MVEKRNRFDIASATARISGTGGRVTGNVITHKKPGLSTLSAIDYLVRYHKHIWQTSFMDAEDVFHESAGANAT